ncbi:restriction endonuclease subunit S [Arthrobacter sp. ISL-85]|uniref:restriction endonuclease subunit S n=1 Tax=Arthrobacter sp. ISL-85 TaxID=2819115 RepID=UPI001BEC15F7|nr:restriction endonuclease subunit S [Arthrobacter sp. ISL-85]MBT2568565.1 restriction endonuclease subunit S [Arthrobacter sp. ISL-85]
MLENVLLGDVAKIDRNLVAPENIETGSIYVGLENVESGGRLINVGTVVNGELASSKFRFTSKHVLYGKLRPYLAKIALPEFDGICSTDILPVLPGPKLDRRYLVHFLRQPNKVQLANSLATGVNLPRLSPKALEKMTVPLPPLDEQRRVAAILDAVDELRMKSSKALVYLEALAQSLFDSMVRNPERLMPATTLADLGLRFSSGKNLVSVDGDAHEHNRVIKVNAVSGGVFQPAESKPLPRSYVPNEQHRIRSGDLLFTRASGSLDLIGICVRVGVVDEQLFLPDKIWRAEFAPGARVCPEYLQSLFKTPSFRAFVNNAASGAAGVKNISQRSVLGFVVNAPDPAAQADFARAFTAIELVKERYRCQLVELDSLFASLEQRAFSGVL